MKSFMRDALAKAQRFFLEPASARPLAALRIGLALILLGQAYLVRSEILELFSSSGYVQGRFIPVLPGPRHANSPDVCLVAQPPECQRRPCHLYAGLRLCPQPPVRGSRPVYED